VDTLADAITVATAQRSAAAPNRNDQRRGKTPRSAIANNPLPSRNSRSVHPLEETRRGTCAIAERRRR